MGVPPVIIHFGLGFSLTKTNQLLGIPMTSWKPPSPKDSPVGHQNGGDFEVHDGSLHDPPYIHCAYVDINLFIIHEYINI